MQSPYCVCLCLLFENIRCHAYRREEQEIRLQVPTAEVPPPLEMLNWSVEEAVAFLCKRSGSSTQRMYICIFQSGLPDPIKVYLSAVRHMHISEGLPDPFIAAMPKLHYTCWEV